MRGARALTAGVAVAAAALTLAACGSSEQADEPSALAEPRQAGDTRLVDVANEVGLDFRQGAFRWDTAPDVAAMQGTGLCWLDYDGDGSLDLFAVNSYAVVEAARWRRADGLPETALFKNDGGRFEDVSEDAGANFAVRGMGCVAADLDTDGDTDLYVTTATEQLLLWNDGDGHFSEGARDAGVAAFGWRSGAAVGDVNGDGLPDLVVAGYADPLNPVTDAQGGFPATVLGVRDLLFLNEGSGDGGRTTFREVGADAGLEVVKFAHGLGVVLTDVDLDDDLDIYLANDTEPDRLYKNVAWPGGEKADPAGLGFRFEEVAAQAGVADPGAGMGVASGDYDGDVLPDLFVTNLRGQGHGVFRTGDAELPPPSFTDDRLVFGPDLFTGSGWGVSWADLDLDTDLDVVLVNGHVPLTDLTEDAQMPQAFENGTAQGDVALFTDASKSIGIADVGRLNARGSAVADYDSDGDLDVAIAVVGGPLLLLENRGEGGRWLEIELARFAPGTRVTVTLPNGAKLVREAQAGSSYVSSEDPRLHFGLGTASEVKSVEVTWPGGAETRLENVEANQLLRLEPPEEDNVADAAAEEYLLPGCERDRADTRSVARVWDEALLDAIRRDVPAPTVHAR
ncbi:MAG: CRTAC1 family protein, partial [Gaiellaceae bacterium]